MVSWKKPDIMEELPELRRTARALEIPLQDLFTAVEDGELIQLSDAVWEKLENTDSFEISAKRAEELADEYSRDYAAIQKAFDDDQELPSPIVLFGPDVPPYLIAGNTRLMCAFANKINPTIWACDFDPNDEVDDES